MSARTRLSVKSWRISRLGSRRWCAQRHLTLTRRAASEQETPQVSARHRENQQNQNPDEREHLHHTSELGVTTGFAQKTLVLPNLLGMLLPKLGGEYCEFGLRRLRRGARAETAPHRHATRKIGEHPAAVNEIFVVLEQRPQSRRLAAQTQNSRAMTPMMVADWPLIRTTCPRSGSYPEGLQKFSPGRPGGAAIVARKEPSRPGARPVQSKKLWSRRTRRRADRRLRGSDRIPSARGQPQGAFSR